MLFLIKLYCDDILGLTSIYNGPPVLFTFYLFAGQLCLAGVSGFKLELDIAIIKLCESERIRDLQSYLSE